MFWGYFLLFLKMYEKFISIERKDVTNSSYYLEEHRNK